MENCYYVYQYIRLDNGSIFYIGKGKNNRFLRLDNRNEHFMNILNSTDCVVEIIYDNLTEHEAFELEMQTIYDLVFIEGYSIDIQGFNDKNNINHLTNCTWGGEGTSGFSMKQSLETIEKRRIKNIGKKRTPEQKSRMREACKTRKEAIRTKESIQAQYAKSSYTQGTHVRCIELDIIFSSKRKALVYMKEEFGIDFNKKTFTRHLNHELIQGHDWYGEILLNGELIRLHWEII